MVLTIGPAVSGASRRELLVWHTFGLLLGGTVMALLVTLAGSALSGGIESSRSVLIPAAAVVVGSWAIKIATGRGVAFPSSTWQVPVSWRDRLPPRMSMASYGFLLGLGFLTAVVFPVYWCFLLTGALAHSILANLLAWWMYAGVRAGSTWIGVYRRFHPDHGDVPMEAPRHYTLARYSAAVTLLAVAALLLIQ